MKASLKSIAKDLNISPGTISRVLNGKAKEYRISEATVKRVKAYAQKVGYTPNLVAKSLQASKSFTIGLILPDISNPFFSTMAKHIEQQASAMHYSILLMDSDEQLEKETKALQQLYSRKVDGIILCPVGFEGSHYKEQFKDMGIPVVFVDRYLKGIDVPFVSSNNYKGAYDAVEFLIQKGHKTIGLIQGDQKLLTVNEREKGFKEALQDYNISFNANLLLGNGFNEENGYVSMLQLLKEKNKPTAILCMSNQICMGVLKAAKELQLNLPQDLSIISFDENPYAEYITPSLTTIKQHNDKMGAKAFNLIYDLIQDQKSEDPSFLIDTEIIERGSIFDLL
ncbi:LacI family DNA-binding transcriptional regulator [Flammeovirga aprica]|uniref:LacI family transcriptional regulator n=1 Tax=Flammeovirga aprica JL-4 TaxID=694437 RepID=A0A7X9RXN9_9BACT|nr:LacI family DNA-binding transcriptional regulator [Flammeovirga aprica]NME70651.1 LacI family transcriptional regulator [Flammeovirga aprica JL-4]